MTPTTTATTTGTLLRESGTGRTILAGRTGRPVSEGGPPAKDPTTSKAGEADLRKALKELDKLTGLDVVKKQVKELTALVRVQKMRRAAKLPVPVMSYHLVFRGNPGTGK